MVDKGNKQKVINKLLGDIRNNAYKTANLAVPEDTKPLYNNEDIVIKLLSQISKSIASISVPSLEADDILEKLKTVDGEDSELNADLLDGYHAEDVSRKLFFTNPVKINTTGWYRIFTSNVSNIKKRTNHIDLIFGKYYNISQDENYNLSLEICYNGKINITQISGIGEPRRIKKNTCII